MKVTKVVLESKYEVVSMICDKCKKEYSDELEIQEFLKIHIFGGFASVFGDGIEIESDICQYCLKEYLGDSYRVTDLGDW